MLDPELLKPERIVPRAGLLSRRAYETFLAHGMFDEGRLELLRGQLVTMSPRGELHATVTAWIAQRLIRALDETYEVRSNSAFAAADDSEPESDISVSRRQRRRAYHPKKALLLIEVAERSLEKDRWIKSAIYAENGAPEYWVVQRVRPHPPDEGWVRPGRPASPQGRPAPGAPARDRAPHRRHVRGSLT